MKAAVLAMVLAAANPAPTPRGEYVCAGQRATIQCMADVGGRLSLRMHAVFIDAGRQYVVVGCAR